MVDPSGPGVAHGIVAYRVLKQLLFALHKKGVLSAEEIANIVNKAGEELIPLGADAGHLYHRLLEPIRTWEDVQAKIAAGKP